MKNDSKNIAQKAPGGLSPRKRPGTDLLESAMQNLAPENRERILAKALEERLALNNEEDRAYHRYETSSQEMGDFVDRAKTLEQSGGSDYSYSQNFRTASGESRIEVKRNNNTVIIVVAIVIGLALIAFFSN